MSVMNFSEEVARLEEGERKGIFNGKDFQITLHKGVNRLHACGADEFLYVLKGEGQLLVEDIAYTLKEGEGIVVGAGKKHKRLTPGVSWLLMAKHPHKHTFYEE